MAFKLVGHRGSGANVLFPVKPVQLMENTIASFAAAAKTGVDMIEFDVQLSKDLIPVVFHDFFVCNQASHMPISSLYYEELVNLVLNGRLPAGTFNNPYFNGSHCVKCKKQTVDYSLVTDMIPTLSNTFLKTPDVQFNIEIKYPTRDEMEDYNLETPVNVEEYCKIIVDSIHPGRHVIISSFHPEVCIWIRRNTEFETLFLTDAGESVSRHDQRLNSLEAAVMFVNTHELHGIVANAAGLLKADRNMINAIAKDKMLYTYGKENCGKDLVIQQIRLGVQGIITDDLETIKELHV